MGKRGDKSPTPALKDKNKAAESRPEAIIPTSNNSNLKRDLDRALKALDESRQQNILLKEDIEKKDKTYKNKIIEYDNEAKWWKQMYEDSRKNSRETNLVSDQSSQSLRIISLEKSNQKLESDIQRSDLKIQELQKENSHYKTRLSSLENRAPPSSSSDSASRSLSTTIKNLEEEKIDLQSKIMKLEKENSDHKTRLLSLESRSQPPTSSALVSRSLSTAIKNLEDDKIDLASKIMKLEKENQNIERENQNIERENLKLGKENQDLRDQNKELEKSFETQSIIFSRKINKYKDKTQQLKNELKKLENELISSKLLIDKSKNSKLSSQQEIDKLKNDLDLQNYEINKLNEQIASLEYIRRDSSKQICELDEKIESYKKTIENFDNSLDERSEDRRILEETMQNNSKMTQNLIEAKNKLKELEILNLEKEKELAIARNEITNLQRKLKSSVQDEIAKIRELALEANRYSKACSNRMIQADQLKFDEKYNLIEQRYDSLQQEIHELLRQNKPI